MLHGGANGYGTRVWNIADLGTSHVDLTLTDPDGTAGFPGTVEATCSYTLKDDGTLHIALTTRTDKADDHEPDPPFLFRSGRARRYP